MDFLFVLFFSIPVFYVWGLISFLRWVFGAKKQQSLSRADYLQTAVSELQKQLQANPSKTLADQLKIYEEELKQIAVASPPSETTSQPNVIEEQPSVSPSHHEPTSPALKNWYKDNSINLLLYIGAFLIIVSATIYVGLDNVSGVSKGLLLTLLTVIFYASGLWFYTISKIRTAGSAFVAIASLLIPITGLGWYNFVYQAAGISLGTVWFITSIVGLGAYIFLARYFKSIFYSYITGFSTLSLSFALINMQSMQTDFYVLASIVNCILLLVISIYFKETKKDTSLLFQEPFFITANVVMPLSLFYGLVMKFGADTVSLQSTLSLFLGCIFYIISYITFRKARYIGAAQVLFAFGLLYFGEWQNYTTLNNLYLMSLVVVINIYLTFAFRNKNLLAESQISAAVSSVTAIILYISAQMSGLETVNLIIFELLALVTGASLAYICRNIYFLFISMFFIAVFLETFINDLLHHDNQQFILGFVYTAFAASWYSLSVIFKAHKKALAVFAASCMAFFALSTFTIADNWQFQLSNFLAMSIVSYSASYRFGKKEFIYMGNSSNTAVIFCLLQLLHIQVEFYPLAYITLSLFYYLLGQIFTNQLKDIFRGSGLVGSFVTVLVYGLYSYSNDYGIQTPAYHALQTNALLASYITCALYSFDAYQKRLSSLGYFASALCMLTYLWQINYLGFDQMLYYTIPLGMYFFILAYLQRRKPNKQSLKDLFNIVSAFFLILPTWTQSFGTEGLQYALLLGMTGLALLVYSITYSDKFYRYTAIAAIVLAVTSQSRWAIIGLAGVGFLGLALYLLLFRKED